jgi:hypothetical protein
MSKHDTAVTLSVEIDENDSAILRRNGDSFGCGRYLRRDQGGKGGNEGTHRATVPFAWANSDRSGAVASQMAEDRGRMDFLAARVNALTVCGAFATLSYSLGTIFLTSTPL